MQALDELLARWRKNPDPESTLALCAHLGTSDQADLMREVASTAEAWHRDNHPVMLSVGRMYLDAGLLAEAQSALIQAGKLAPKDTEAYRYLGEVLLRRGDAIRGEKTLARAIQMGDADEQTRLWYERAVVYVALQKRQGLAAVADEVARTAPHQPSIPAPTLSAFDRMDRETATNAASPARTSRRSRPPLAPAPGRTSARRRPSTPAGRRRSDAPAPAAQFLGTKSEPQDTLLMGGSPVPVPPLTEPVHPPSPFFPSGSHAPQAARAARGASALARSTPQAAASRRPRPTVAELRRGPEPANDASRRARTLARRQVDGGADPFQGTFSDLPAPDDELFVPELARPAPVSVPTAPPAPPPIAPSAAPSPAPSSAPSPTSASVASRPPTSSPSPASSKPPTSSKPRLRQSAPPEPLDPSPEAVLSELARVGLYEQDSAVVPAWEAAPRSSPRRLWLMAGALLAAAGIGLGTHHQVIEARAESAAQAQELGMRLASALDSGGVVQLRDTEADFQRLFELDSRGREPALLWLKNRALHVLLQNDPVSGIESALQRARAVGIEEAALVFGRLASSLAASDLPAAAATIAEWDERAKGDAFYQLLAGVVLERAGNAEALDRYVLSTRLQPDLKLSHVYAARLGLLQLGPAAAQSLVDVARARLGPGPASDVIGGLQWAASPLADGPAPILAPPESSRDLSPLLQETASAVLAVKAQREGRLEASMAAFERALGPSATPAMAAWIGYQALDAGDVEIARLAALKSVELSVMHASSQTLAARIALAEGRLDAAREAARGADPSSRDALLIEAVSAYENLQGPEAVRLVARVPVGPSNAATLDALVASDKAIAGSLRVKDERLEQLATEPRLWGAIVAVDLALDSGRLAAAERIARDWDAQVPAYAARLVRLRRYQGQGSAALELASALLDPRVATPRAVSEVVLAFVGEGRVAAATTALQDLSSAAGGLAPWLEVLVEVARGREPNARKQVAELLPPDKNRPLLEQAIALRALAAAQDRRAKAYYGQLERRFRGHPDVSAAGRRLGLIR